MSPFFWYDNIFAQRLYVKEMNVLKYGRNRECGVLNILGYNFDVELELYHKLFLVFTIFKKNCFEML